MIHGATQLFGVLGNPVGHSLSPAMHNAAFAACGIDAVYIPLQSGTLREAFFGIKAMNFIGVSVTVPYKVAIMDFLDEVDSNASRIGAVNTLCFRTEAGGVRRCIGSNTDWEGSNQALAHALELVGSRVLVLGAGGAARAVAFGLLQAGAEVILTNRSQDKGEQLAAFLGCSFVAKKDLGTVGAGALVNTTSAGMAPDCDSIAIDPNFLPNFKVVMDLVYAPQQTRLLSEARQHGCVTISGLEMLLYQAAAQWKYWLIETSPPLEAMRQALHTALAASQ